MNDTDLYKFYPIAFLILLFFVHIWRYLFLKKEFSPLEHLPIIILILSNLYLDTCLAFYRGFPFEFTNKLSLYFSVIALIFSFPLLIKDFSFISELKKLFKRPSFKADIEKELPSYYKSFENLAKSVQINQIKAEKSKRGLLIICLFFILSFLMLFSEIYVDLKKLQSYWEISQILDFLNYPMFFYNLFKMIDKNNRNYTYNHKIAISPLLKKYYSVVMFLMIAFDWRRPKNFVNQDWCQQYLTRAVYGLLLLHLLWIFYNKERVLDKDAVGKKRQLGESNELVCNIQIPILVYLFFLNDETDRLIMGFYIIPFYRYIVKSYFRMNSPLMKLLIVSVILKMPDIFHVIFKGTMTFDISLPAGNKTIGRNYFIKLCGAVVYKYQDEYPIFTGVLFGTHKLQHYLIGAIFMMNLLGKESQNKEEEKITIYKIMFSKYLLCQLPLWFFVFSKQQSLYLTIFMFTMGKAGIVVLFYLLNFIMMISTYLKTAKSKNNII